jgi:hypothetical protein
LPERIVIKDDYLSFGQKNEEGLRTAVEEPGKNLRKYKRINSADAALNRNAYKGEPGNPFLTSKKIRTNNPFLMTTTAQKPLILTDNMFDQLTTKPKFPKTPENDDRMVEEHLH